LIQYSYTHQRPKIVVFINQFRLSGGLNCAADHIAEIPKQDWTVAAGNIGEIYYFYLLLSQTLANEVISIVDDFQCTNYRSLYLSFMQELGKTLNNELIIGVEKTEKIQQFLCSSQNHL